MNESANIYAELAVNGELLRANQNSEDANETADMLRLNVENHDENKENKKSQKKKTNIKLKKRNSKSATKKAKTKNESTATTLILVQQKQAAYTSVSEKQDKKVKKKKQSTLKYNEYDDEQKKGEKEKKPKEEGLVVGEKEGRMSAPLACSSLSTTLLTIENSKKSTNHNPNSNKGATANLYTKVPLQSIGLEVPQTPSTAAGVSSKVKQMVEQVEARLLTSAIQHKTPGKQANLAAAAASLVSATPTSTVRTRLQYQHTINASKSNAASTSKNNDKEDKEKEKRLQSDIDKRKERTSLSKPEAKRNSAKRINAFLSDVAQAASSWSAAKAAAQQHQLDNACSSSTVNRVRPTGFHTKNKSQKI